MNWNKFHSKHLDRLVDISVCSAESDDFNEIIIINDGQDLPKMNLKALVKSYSTYDIRPLIIGCAAAHNEGRKQEYGVQWAADYHGRGAKANKYAQFITDELLGWISENYTIAVNARYTLAGWSLGALSAMDIAWHAPEKFQRVGVFSGSLWWRNPHLINDDVHNRLMHHKVKHTAKKPNLKFWFQAGTEDEKADRNNNGIIDVIDDTLDLIVELEAKGYEKGTDFHFHIEEGGKHDVETWSKMMPLFLNWLRAN